MRPTMALLRNWKGQRDTSIVFINDPTPPALVEFLLGADRVVLSAALTYCTPGLMFDGVTSDNEARHIEMVIPPATVHARVAVTRFAAPSGVPQSAALVNADSSGTVSTTFAFASDADTVTLDQDAYGTLAYGDANGYAQASMLVSSDHIDNAPAATIDRQLEMPEGKVRQLETVEVKYAAGLGLFITTRTDDLETL